MVLAQVVPEILRKNYRGAIMPPILIRVNKFCKHILGVHRNTTNLAIQGELGTFPLLIDEISMVSYYLNLRQLNNHLIADALSENKKVHAKNNNMRSRISVVD